MLVEPHRVGPVAECGNHLPHDHRIGVRQSRQRRQQVAVSYRSLVDVVVLRAVHEQRGIGEVRPSGGVPGGRRVGEVLTGDLH